MRKLPPAPVPYAKALPAPVATWLAMRTLPLSQWGAVRMRHNHSGFLRGFRVTFARMHECGTQKKGSEISDLLVAH
jgi:hypothetical protein